jgi:hypothetical protein
MNQNPSPRDGSLNPGKNLPPTGKGVRVRHKGRECAAYLDGQGKWRNYYNGDLLAGEVTIISADLES